MGVTEDVAQEGYKDFWKKLGLSAKLVAKLSRNLGERIERRYNMILNAKDPDRAARKMIRESSDKVRQQLSIALAQGAISHQDFDAINRKLKEENQYSNLKDAAVRIELFDTMADYTKKLNIEVSRDPKKKEELFKDLTNDYKQILRVPDMIQGQDGEKLISPEQLPKTLDQSISDVKLRERAKQLFGNKAEKEGRSVINKERNREGRMAAIRPVFVQRRHEARER